MLTATVTDLARQLGVKTDLWSVTMAQSASIEMPRPSSWLGALKGTCRITGDIVAPTSSGRD
jgi:hypothetical protein